MHYVAREQKIMQTRSLKTQVTSISTCILVLIQVLSAWWHEESVLKIPDELYIHDAMEDRL